MANKKADFKLDDMEKIKEQLNVEDCWFDEKEHLFHCLMKDGSEWTSPKGRAQDEWIRVPKSKELTRSQESIAEIVDATKDLLLYKNKMYGDSALNPVGIFTKHLKTAPENTASILVRLDDKLGRVRNAESLRVNDVSDIIGYCTLLLISMGVTKEDIAKFKD